jgi:hypothetical protein
VSRPRRAALTLGLATLALAAALLAAAWPAASARLELEQARARWAARPFRSYRVEVEQTLATSCRYVIEVRDDRIAGVPFNSCSQLIWWRDMPARTVDGILDNLGAAAGGCAPTGCACDGVVVMEARFDPALGYPLEARLTAEPGLRWLHPDFWRRLLGPPRLCPASGHLGLELTIKSVTPLD